VLVEPVVLAPLVAVEPPALVVLLSSPQAARKHRDRNIERKRDRITISFTRLYAALFQAPAAQLAPPNHFFRL
jgi:hypothetical protein